MLSRRGSRHTSPCPLPATAPPSQRLSPAYSPHSTTCWPWPRPPLTWLRCRGPRGWAAGSSPTPEGLGRSRGLDTSGTDPRSHLCSLCPLSPPCRGRPLKSSLLSPRFTFPQGGGAGGGPHPPRLNLHFVLYGTEGLPAPSLRRGIQNRDFWLHWNQPTGRSPGRGSALTCVSAWQ